MSEIQFIPYAKIKKERKIDKIRVSLEKYTEKNDLLEKMPKSAIVKLHLYAEQTAKRIFEVAIRGKAGRGSFT